MEHIAQIESGSAKDMRHETQCVVTMVTMGVKYISSNNILCLWVFLFITTNSHIYSRSIIYNAA